MRGHGRAGSAGAERTRWTSKAPPGRQQQARGSCHHYSQSNPDLTGRTSGNYTFQTRMVQAFVITLREGLEAFLIVAISLAYLRKSQQHRLIGAVHWGIGIALLLSIGAAYLFSQAANQALWEGVLALVAAVLVTSLIIHMWRHAK